MKLMLMTFGLFVLGAGTLYPLYGSAQDAPAQQPSQEQGAAPQVGAQQGKPYTVICQNTGQGRKTCKVDRKTYVGWRTYHAFCYQCHAQDAVGSSFAPSLVDRLKAIDRERFVSSVMNGFKGQIGVMPAWKDNPNVSRRIDELYAYLRARSDGALGLGKPERLEQEPATAGR